MRGYGDKRSAYESRSKKRQSDTATDAVTVPADLAEKFPPSATLCHKCNTKATIIMDGCATCLNCGYSKCG